MILFENVLTNNQTVVELIIVATAWAITLVVTWIYSALRQIKISSSYLDQEKINHLDTKRRLDAALLVQSNSEDLAKSLKDILNTQYQARLDQADARLDDYRIINSRLDTDNKALLDRCLARNNFAPIHQPPRNPSYTAAPTVTHNNGAHSLGQRAQDQAALDYQNYVNSLNASNPPQEPEGQ